MAASFALWRPSGRLGRTTGLLFGSSASRLLLPGAADVMLAAPKEEPGMMRHEKTALQRQIFTTAAASSSSSAEAAEASAAAASASSSAPSDRSPKGWAASGYSVADFPPERIRNFSIIAHVDHGKSTLADRLLEITGAINKGSQNQYLDKLQVERERGITVKAQTASLVHRHEGKDYLLNLIDTPGHVDFSYEVSRSLAACQGAVLLVDAVQGVQAQTMANFYLAFEQDLSIVPVVNKVDLPTAEPERVAKEMLSLFDLPIDETLNVSAKTGLGLEQLLPAIIERVPHPRGDTGSPLRLLLFDAYHDDYRGVICLVEVVDGEVKKGDRITAASTGEHYDVNELGLLVPEPHPTGRLLTGQVGYIITGMKTTRSARVGDTWHHYKQPVNALPGFKPAKAMVFAGVFPISGGDFEQLQTAMEQLTLNDSSVTVTKESSDALGAGFRCGFLGLLHLDVFLQRLEQEYGASVITTAPTVPFVVYFPDGTNKEIMNPSEFPVGVKIQRVEEPTVKATVILPDEFIGPIMELCMARRGEQTEHVSLGGQRSMLKYTLPLSELGSDFYDALKSRSRGYASFDYEEGDYRPAELQRLDLMINGHSVDALARVVHRGSAQRVGRELCAKLKEQLDRAMFEIIIQAAGQGKIVARETVKALRKNVLAKCYGGDVSRKRKLLDKQKEGKKRMRRLGQVDVPQSAFYEMMKLN